MGILLIIYAYASYSIDQPGRGDGGVKIERMDGRG